VLVREGDRWRITAPVATAADADQARTLLRSLNEMTALAFYDGAEVDRAKFGLDAPSLEVQAEFGDKGTAGFRLGTKTPDSPPGYYFERTGDGQVAKIPEWVRNRFDQNLNALRDKRLFDCEATDVAKVRYERSDGQSFDLIKKDGRWTMDPAPERPLKDAFVERTVSSLATLAGKEIVTDDGATPEKLVPYGLDAPVAEVTISRADGSSCGSAMAATTGSGDDATYYLKRGDAGTVMSVPAYLYARIEMKPEDFLETPKELPAAAEGAPAPASPASPDGGLPPEMPPPAGEPPPPAH
jgi:hypothetical protein